MLIVEDDVSTRQVLRDVFRDAGFDVIACPDLATAREAIAEYARPDIALVDFALPDGLGIDLCQVLRGEGIPCVIVSAYPTWLTQFAQPQSNWIAKPFDMDHLVAVVRTKLTESRVVEPKLT